MALKTKKFYAVKTGLKPGVYLSWEECRLQVEGYPRAAYKSFPTLEGAEAYLEGIVETQARPPRPANEVNPTKIVDSGDSSKRVVIYADGACSGNPGPGGYGAIVGYGGERTELSGGFRRTTNNRMEILGCIAALRVLKEPCDVTIYSDSRYVVNTMSQSWALRWRKNGWIRKEQNGELKPVLNQDLWIEMLDLCDKHRVQFEWVRGHDGNEGNERCDELARHAASRELGVDSAYENAH